ncbi:hypothetical protein PK98_06265 [Croceibacterium mercuriale]|uniref:Sec-independent protein translocase protein TatA n=1 Tax=Croceibacterium mercuriale TaxID=1572751 RepID=A0A0B2C1R9_9SPHN|nr:twin-arginine translocase TatA/TatE family subunit [Croceibacterium mercuriale]KHL26120.1 hypothetical protein PK98_06265 [Croceibacterium mercuriale]
MAGFSLMHWVIVALVILVLFGRGKISETMGDFGKGIKSFRKGLTEEESAPVTKPAQIAQINDEKTQGVPVDTATRSTNS